MKEKIKAVAFDIGGVLDIGDAYYGYLSKSLGIDIQDFIKASDNHVKKAINGKITTKQLVSSIAKRLNMDADDLLKKWVKSKRLYIKKDKDVENIIKKLRKNKYKIATLTNVSDIHHRIRIEKGFYDHFHFNICSCEVGLSKPNIRIYKLLIKKLKLKPEEIIFVDDVKECLIPAKKLGIKTILFRNAKQLARDLKKFDVKLK